MIVTSHHKGWKIISQRSHGLLASMLAYQYAIDLPNEIIVPTLIAIAEHDDGIAETLANKNLTDAGAPRHFLVEDKSNTTNLDQQYNVMEIATSKSQLNAYLTSMHLDFIFKENKKSDRELADFLDKQRINRTKILKSLDIDKEYGERLYRFVEWCDAFSLLICMDKIQPEGRKMDVSINPDGIMNTTYYKDKNVICVEPWVFKEDAFNVYYEFRIVEQLKFKSVKEFDEVYKNAKVQKETFTFKK